MKRALVALAAAGVVAGLLVPVQSSTPAADSRKLRGGLSAMLALGSQPDQRLDYLVPDMRKGDFVVYVNVTGPAAGFTRRVTELGAKVRWAFRSVNAISAVASKKTVLALAAQPWVESLYPVLSGRVDDTATNVSGTMTQGDKPQTHDIVVPADTRSITVDLAVAPPGQAHLDINTMDYLEATLADASGHVVAARPSFLGQIAFRYGEPATLQTGTWKLTVLYRRANFPTIPFIFTYSGTATVSGTELARDEAAAIPAYDCSGTRNVAAWKSNPNLKKRGVTDLGAPALWERGIRGRGVRVAVLDTGTDTTHVDLNDQDFERWGASGCSPKVISNALFTGGQKFDGEGVWDTGGHGTHVSGEISGTAQGASDEEKGKYPGVAPESSLIAGRIAIDVTALSDDMLAAGEWAVIDQRADVVNLSFGIDVRYGVLTDRFDPQSLGFEALATNPAWGHPSLMVSAGNSGDYFSTIGAPSAAPHVNTIAAAVKDWDLALANNETREDGNSTVARAKKDKNGRVHPSIAIFSSRGPTQDLLFAPDFAAPGRYIVAPRSNQTPSAAGLQNAYASFSGTSMAAPHAAGSAALLVDGYRQRYGSAGAFGNRPPFWAIAAAMSNTAWMPPVRPSFVGGKLAKIDYSASANGAYQMYGEVGSRESLGDARPVGPLVEGAGRINVVGALATLTDGVLVYTAGNPSNPAEYELQPNLQFGLAKPNETVTRQLRLDPQTAHGYSVAFRVSQGTPSMNSGAIESSWWTLPASTSITAGTAKDIPVALRVPATQKPGFYTGYLFADIKDKTNGNSFTARLPVLVVVQPIDTSAEAGDGHRTSITGYSKSTDPSTFQTTSVIDAVNSDWPMYAVDVPPGLTSLDVTLAGASGEEWDLFVYDRYGVAIADTFMAPPLLDGTAMLSIPNLEPGMYRIAVSRTMPTAVTLGLDEDTDVRGAPYTLTVDLVGAASVLPKSPTKVGGKKIERPVKPSPGKLPATGVPDAALYAMGALGLASAGGLAFGIRKRLR